MLIDTLSIQYSGDAASDVVSDPSQQRFINAWTNLLRAHGWTEVEQLHATATITFPLGAPVTNGIIGPLDPTPCSAFPGSLAIGAQWFTFYDPFHQDPIPGSCIFVPEDVTPGGSLANLVIAINTSTNWFAVLVYNGGVSWTINLTAVSAGPEFNFVIVQSSGLASGTDRSSGGGYRLESSGDSNSAVYRCACTNANSGGAGINYLGGNILFTFTINGSNSSYQLLDATQGTLGFMGSLGVGAVPEYTIIANPYGFAVFDLPRDTTTHIFRTISLFAMAPYFPTADSVPPSENFVPAYAVFVVGPNLLGGAPSWNSAFSAGTTMCLDGTPWQSTGFSPQARLLAYRSPSQALLSPQALMFHYGAYVQFGSTTGNTSPAWVVGKLWDVAIVTDFIASDAIMDGHGFLTMGYSDGSAGYTVCTVMMASSENPSGPGKSGTVNLFGDGVTWLTGDLFDASMEGGPITIAGTAYIVKTFVDSKHLTLTTAVTIISGATYSAPDPSTPSTGGQSTLCIAAPGASSDGVAFSNSGH
jgi:hypothetical protein